MELAVLDFQALADSPEWQTYIALQAAFNSIADAERRDRVRAALAASEQERRARVAAGPRWSETAVSAHRKVVKPRFHYLGT